MAWIEEYKAKNIVGPIVVAWLWTPIGLHSVWHLTLWHCQLSMGGEKAKAVKKRLYVAAEWLAVCTGQWRKYKSTELHKYKNTKLQKYKSGQEVFYVATEWLAERTRQWKVLNIATDFISSEAIWGAIWGDFLKCTAEKSQEMLVCSQLSDWLDIRHSGRIANYFSRKI